MSGGPYGGGSSLATVRPPTRPVRSNPAVRPSPRENIATPLTDPGPTSPLLPFPAQFMRVGAVAVGLGYGAVMGMFSGLVRSRSPASSAHDPSAGTGNGNT